MKKHLLIFFLAALLAAGLNERNNTRVASADFPTSEQTSLSQTDDAWRVEIAREANSLFVPPAAQNLSAGDNSQQTNFRIRHAETAAFTSAATVRDDPAPPAAASYIIARNGAFHRPSDYYVYTLRHIVV